MRQRIYGLLASLTFLFIVSCGTPRVVNAPSPGDGNNPRTETGKEPATAGTAGNGTTEGSRTGQPGAGNTGNGGDDTDRQTDPGPTFEPSAPTEAATTEKESIVNGLSFYLEAGGLRVGNLTRTDTDDGGVELAGDVSLFGIAAVRLSGSVREDLTAERLAFIFPPGARLEVSALQKMLGGSSMVTFLPPGFPVSGGLAVDEMAIDFEEDGFTINLLTASFGAKDYRLPNPMPLTITDPSLELFAERPTKADRSIGGTISGNSSLGGVRFDLATTLSSDPAAINFTGEMGGLRLGDLLDALATEPETRQLMSVMPAVFTDLSLSTLRLEAQPFNKKIGIIGVTSMGAAQLLFDGSGPSPNLVFGLAPPEFLTSARLLLYSPRSILFKLNGNDGWTVKRVVLIHRGKTYQYSQEFELDDSGRFMVSFPN